MPIRKFVFSCGTFGGFIVEINVQTHHTLDELVEYSVTVLRDTLKLHSLDMLVEQLSKKKYHIHDRTVQEIVATGNTVYVCTCSH
jgi:hypothetical protein